MKKGCTYATVFRTAIGKWRKGQEVHLVNVEGEDFLRTDSNNMLPQTTLMMFQSFRAKEFLEAS